MVGNSVNSHAEMSADIASIPPWKIKLLERKRLHEKESTGSTVNHTPSAGSGDQQVVDNGVPAWRSEILTRKQNQTNSSVFLAKHGQTDNSHSKETVSAVNNGHVHSLVFDSLCGSTEPALAATVVDIEVNDAVADQPVEERLLPIHQNPILRLDLKNRSQSSSSGSARNSMSPRAASTSGGGHEHSSTVSSVSQPPSHPITPDAAIHEDVFRNDNDCETEVAYGKGFVHKLLMKFSHLSSSRTCDQTTNNRHPKPRFSSLGDSSKSSGTGPRRQSSRDLESISSKLSSGMPTTKYHSADDLLSETTLHARIDGSDSADELDITADYELNGEISTHMDHSAAEDDTALKINSSCAEVADELPFANIVSNARSLFESLAVHSASQKQSPSPSSTQIAASSRFSYIGTLERSHQSKRTSVVKTDTPEVSAAPKKFNQPYSSLNRSVKSTAEVSHSNDTTASADDGDSRRISDSRIETDANYTVQGNVTAVSNPPSLNSTYTHGSVFNCDVHISTNPPSQSPASAHADSSTSENSVHSVKPSTKEKELETIPSPSTAQSNTPAVESGPFLRNKSIIVDRPVHIDSSSLSSQFANTKENVKSQPAFTVKKPAPSRPGKLVIRPASNLVAAKTSTEYLELTKFNDVRKGEFAPPIRKERIDPDGYEDVTDKADGVTDDFNVTEEYVFTGAGVLIGRSLLTKTNRNKSVKQQEFISHLVLMFFIGCFH